MCCIFMMRLTDEADMNIDNITQMKKILEHGYKSQFTIVTRLSDVREKEILKSWTHI